MSLLRTALLTLGVLMGSTPAQAQGGSVVPTLPECALNPARGCSTSVQLRAVSAPSWRGYTDRPGSGGILVPAVALQRGIVRLEAQGHLPQEGDAGGTVGLFLQPDYAPADDGLRFAAGVREYLGGGPVSGVDREIVVGVMLPHALPVPETDISLRADVAQLLGDEIDGTYARVSAWPPIPGIGLGSGTLTVHPEAGVAASTLPRTGDPSPGLHYHAADVRLDLLYDLAGSGEDLNRLPLRIGIDAGWLWPGDGMGESKGWVAARLILDLAP